tara:strand:- start:9746 stop:11401 length:1656 start_codon:yes stop_codon:yes gene_type:complete
MRVLILFISLSAQLIAQDTIVLPLSQEPSEIYIDDCNHGHICCEFNCPCCSELKRNQEFDTVRFWDDRSDRTIALLKERYRYAKSHELRPVFISISNGKRNEHWFPLNPILQIEPFLNEWEVQPRLFINEKEDRIRYIDSKGDICAYSWIHKESHETTSIGVILEDKSALFGLVTNQGDLKGDYLFSDYKRTSSNHLIVEHPLTEKLGVINMSGELLIPFKYRKIRYLGYELFAVREGFNSWHIIDQDGGRILFRKVGNVGEFSEGYLALNFDRSGTIYIDSTGKKVIHTNAHFGEDFSDGVAAVMKDQQWGLIDTLGNFLIDYKYERIGHFFDGTAPAKDRRNNSRLTAVLINKKGEVISKPYHNITPFKDGLAQCFINGQGYGFINSTGKEIVPPLFYRAGYGSYNSYFPFDRLPVRKVHRDRVLPYTVINQRRDTLFSIKGIDHIHFLHTYNDPYNVLPYFVIRKDQKHQLISIDDEKLIMKSYMYITGLNTDLVLLNGYKREGNSIYSLAKRKVIRRPGLFKIHGVYESFIVLELNNGEKELVLVPN